MRTDRSPGHGTDCRTFAILHEHRVLLSQLFVQSRPSLSVLGPHCRQPSKSRWADEGNGLALVAPVDAEVSAVNGEHAVARIELAHTNEAEVREVGLPIRVSLGSLGTRTVIV